MATTKVQGPVLQIPGLTTPFTDRDLRVAARMYNSLSDIDESPDVSAVALVDLARIFVKHKVHGLFEIGLIHNHCTMSCGEVMLSTKLKNSVSGCWNQGEEIAVIDVAQVRGHIFKHAGNRRLVAFKLEEAQVTDHNYDNGAFIREFCDHLMANGLTEVLGLQVLGGDPTTGIEFDSGEVGTIIIDETDANHGQVSHATGQTFFVDNAGIVSCKDSTTHAPTTKGPHKVFVDSKLAQDEHGLMKILNQYDVLVRYT